MLFQSTIEASKNWSNALNRLGFGALLVAVASYLGFFPALLDFGALSDSDLTFAQLPHVIFLLLFSMLVGGVVISVGAIGRSESFGERARVVRAHRVGATGNTLLAEILRDAQNRYEQASGFIGLLYLGTFLSLLSYFTGAPPSVSVPEGVDLSWREQLYTALYGAIGGLSGRMILTSATSTIEAIDSFLDAQEPLNKDAAP